MTASCLPTPAQFLAVCADWNRRAALIAKAAQRWGAEDILHQLVQIGLDLAAAAWAIERESAPVPASLALLMGQVDRRLIEIECRVDGEPAAQPDDTAAPSRTEPHHLT